MAGEAEMMENDGLRSRVTKLESDAFWLEERVQKLDSDASALLFLVGVLFVLVVFVGVALIAVVTG